MEPTGRLILIPNLLGPDSKELTIPPGVSNTINQLRHFIVENNKTAADLRGQDRRSGGRPGEADARVAGEQRLM